MCGLVGAVAHRNVVPVLLEGLRQLEYRGYDSAGVATLNGHGLECRRTTGRVDELVAKLAASSLSGEIGIGHTRWATHGEPVEVNAHPHVSSDSVALVHNGIIENYETLRTELVAAGYTFRSETDTEAVAHLIHYHLQQESSLSQAVVNAVGRLDGSYAIAVICANDPQTMVVARRGSPLLIGVGRGENFVASDITALLPVTQRFIYLEEGDVAEITDRSVTVFDAAGQIAVRPLRESKLSSKDLDKAGYSHYMLKEIFEQGSAIAKTLADGVAEGRVLDTAFGANSIDILRHTQHVHVVACGTSYHAGTLGRAAIEAHAHIPCMADLASEYRYRSPVVPPNTLFVALSQSGETADTLAAIRYARQLGYLAVLSICNVPDSAMVRESDLVFLTQAGPEIGVASTKAFTTQLAAMYMLAVLLARCNGLSRQRELAMVQSLLAAPDHVERVLGMNESFEALAQRLVNREHALFLGRGSMFPVAMEGALKLKEISYIHAEAYSAGELKHGPLALVDENMPVVALAPNNRLLGKLKSNLKEVRARKGELFIFADEHAFFERASGETLIRVPAVDNLIAPIVYTVPLQLLAYHVAVLKGTDVDRPRNLAKSVTVE